MLGLGILLAVLALAVLAVAVPSALPSEVLGGVVGFVIAAHTLSCG